MKGDLHIHTTISDGSMAAEEILRMAKAKNISHIAFTDHDTVKNAKEHQMLAGKYGLKAVKAVEMSAFHSKTGKKVHILGYGYDTGAHIVEIGTETLKKRNNNCLMQMEILNSMGFKMDAGAVKIIARECIYKQHILDYLVISGQSEQLFGQIYQTIFKNGGRCDFDIRYPEAEEVVAAICRDGGYAVLAHPGQQDNFDIVPELVDCGLSGIERNHPANTREHRQKIDALCSRYSLFITGGSDFHGNYEKNPSALGGELLETEKDLPFFRI